MILIICQDSYEESTIHVIDWLIYLKHDFMVLNGYDFYKSIRITIDNNEINFYINEINFNEISLIWLRRWYTRANIEEIFFKVDKDNFKISTQLNEQIRKELISIWDYFTYKFFDLFINYREFKEINKLIVLEEAIKIGLTVPETIIVSDIKNLNFDIENYISKAISNIDVIKYKGKSFMGYTVPFDEFKLNKFCPSLLQKNIDKEFEIRSFYIEEKIFSMAIFSQSDVQTKNDFRVYNHIRPNRNVPYKLPKEIEKKITKLMKKLKLNMGSIDLLKGIDNVYYFLEINPEGQFGMVSHPCNYNLEKKIALKLIKNGE